MKRKFIIGSSSILFCLVFLSATIRKSSSGAPASHTGAPGEKTCATAGCHDDTTPNIGNAQLTLQLGENETVYVAGQTYPLKVKITDPKVTRFGFQIVVLDAKSNRDIGGFGISDSVRTQMVTNAYKLKDRNYVTYTFDGTDALSEGHGEWTINWTAPSDIKKPVTFYVAAVSGNDDMTDKGDKVYTTHVTFKQAHLK